MPKRSDKKKRPSDENQLAASIVSDATGKPTKTLPRKKNPAAVALGRLGGLVGGPARAKLSKEILHDIGKKGADARWKGHKKKKRKK